MERKTTINKMSREEISARDIRATLISAASAKFLVIVFFLCIFGVPFVQHLFCNNSPLPVFSASPYRVEGQNLFTEVKSANNSVLEWISKLEKVLEDDSFLRGIFLPPIQYIQLHLLGKGNEQVVVGRDGWLFYQQGFDHLVQQPFLQKDQLAKREREAPVWSPPVQPDPVKALVDMRDQLAARGVELLVVPVPVKMALYPENFVNTEMKLRPVNRSRSDFLSRLKQNNVHFLDPLALLQQAKNSGTQVYLQHDTHWTPEAMAMVAAALAKKIVQLTPLPASTEALTRIDKIMQNEGDLTRMLTLPADVDLFTRQEVQGFEVINKAGEIWQPDRNSPVLLLGDSFTNIYSRPGLGWGYGGGLAELISYSLQHSVDLIAINDSGAFMTRERLAAELQRGSDRLQHKKLVVYEFAERELSFGDWKLLDFTVGEQRQSQFFTVSTDEPVVVSATVDDISASPRPGTVPYRNNILTLHLVDINGENISGVNSDALVYGLGMRDNQLTPLATVRPGDKIKIKLINWQDVEKDYSSYRRSPLDDEMVELEIPNWGELIK